MVVKTAIYVSFQGFQGKHLVLKIEHDFKLLRTLIWKKMGLSIKEFFSGFNQQKLALPEKYFDEKRFLFRKCFLFLLSFLEFQWFFCLFAKFFSLVCQTTDQRRERKKLGKLTWKNSFFNQFWTLRRKNLDFQQNCKAWFSKPLPTCADDHLQKFFYGSKTIWMKVFGLWTETSVLWRKWFLRVVKGGLQVSSATLWEKVDKSKLCILWLD